MAKAIIIVFSLISIITISNALEYTREKDESLEDFVNRIGPSNTTLTHEVISTIWNGKPSILAFYNETYKLPIDKDPDQQEYVRILGYVYIHSKDSAYDRYFIDTIDTEGGDPKIETVFFANADKDKQKELLIIASWEQIHAAVNGTLYNTRVFDNIGNTKNGKLIKMDKISEKVDGGCDCTWEDGTTKVVKFKTAAAIKSELKKLGY
jgi:hypothetical protein